MAKARPPGKKAAWPNASRRPLDLSNPTPLSEQRAAHEGVEALRSRSKVIRTGAKSSHEGVQARRPKAGRTGAKTSHGGTQDQRSKPSRTGAKAPARPRAPRRRAPAHMSPKARLGLVLVASVLLAWLLPVLGKAGDGVVPTALYLYLFAAFAGMVVVALGQRPAWVIPGFLAVLGLIWAGGLAPELLKLPMEPGAVAFWPKAPQTEGAMALWRIVALVLAAIGTGLAALHLAPPRPPLRGKARSRLKRR